MAESYFNHLTPEEVSPAMIKWERKRKVAPNEDASNTKIKLENEQSNYSDFSKRMMVRHTCNVIILLL